MLRLFFSNTDSLKFPKTRKGKNRNRPVFAFSKKAVFTKKLDCFSVAASRETVDVQREATFEVGRFVFVDIVVFCQFVQHRDHLHEERRSFRWVFHLAELFHARAGGLFVITVDKAAFFGLPDALFSGCVVSHFIF